MPTLISRLTASPRARWARVLGWLLVVLAGALAVERWRGQSALRAWREQRAAQGESRDLDLTLLWPKPDEQARQFSSRLAQATRQLPAELAAFSGRISAMVPDQPGRARRGSQEPQPPGVQTKSWRQFDTAVSNARVELEHLRQLMNQAPASMGDDIRARMFPNCFGARSGAQTLHAVVIHDLHQGNLDAALANLTALSSSVRLYADEPTLMIYLSRVAILGLSVDAYWDALQAPGWTGNQLAQMQQAAPGPQMLTQAPRVAQAERAARLASWEWFRSHSYNAWIDRHADLYKGFGMKLPDSRTARLHRQWQQWGFHPVWRFAWANQDVLDYLEHSQAQVAAIREAVELQSWRHLEERLVAIERDYRPPAARWRFHGRLPLYDDVFATMGSSRSPEPACPHPDYREAWQATFKSLTLHQLVITAIALKRHELRHGRHPATLDALVPEFLPAVPRDLMDGQPLRYRLNQDGSFLLYSVGDDVQDDGGDPVPKNTRSDDPSHLWNGRDWVWPQMSAAEG